MEVYRTTLQNWDDPPSIFLPKTNGFHFFSHPETSEVMNPYLLLAFGPI